LQADLFTADTHPIAAGARSGSCVSGADDTFGALSLPEWLHADDPASSLALPIVVGGRAVAVLYVEGVNPRAHGGSGREELEILARHTGRCLEVITLARFSSPGGAKAVRSLEWPHRGPVLGPEEDSRRQEESARRYARLLISEVKLYNETTVEEGRQHGDILARLGPEIERARRLYEEKIPAVVRERSAWFEEELVRTLAGGDAGSLGQVT
jgi:hypothetical protein